MEQTIEQRLSELEKEVAELKAEVRKEPGKEDWRSTVGWAKDDPTYEEAMKLGRAWRNRQPKNGDVVARPRHGSSERSRSQQRGKRKVAPKA